MALTVKQQAECEHGEPVYWNPYNQVVQCHICGQVFEPKELKQVDGKASFYVLRS